MPIYEYKCKKCDKLFEEYMSAKSEQTIKCPECDQVADRQMSKTYFKVHGFNVLNGYAYANK